MPKKTKIRPLPQRNDAFFDGWSIVHLCTGIALGWIMAPLTALIIMIIWEPLEIFVISPLVARYGIIFGYETIRNSLSDIIFDTIGVLIGAFLVAYMWQPPIHIF